MVVLGARGGGRACRSNTDDGTGLGLGPRGLSASGTQSELGGAERLTTAAAALPLVSLAGLGWAGLGRAGGGHCCHGDGEGRRFQSEGEVGPDFPSQSSS